eukprot:SAG22_NODE_949_length_6356_cov_2.100527_4_plen_441_part_00
MVRVSYMEIYNEKVRDLLNPQMAGEELKVREDPKTGFYVESQEVVVTNDDMIYAMLDAGNQLRTVGATNMNAQSSRSHAIFRLILESSPKEGVEQEGTAEENAFRSSYLNLVDLAGSERTKDTGASGSRLKEAGSINLSLSCLSNIIRALSDASMKKGKAKSKVHLPFRNSKLTQILQPSLGGNSRTAFICTVTLAAQFYEDTKSTLAFADRAKKVTNKPKKNILVNEKAMLQEAQDEIAQLKRALELAGSGSGGGGGGGGGAPGAPGGGETNKELQNKIAFLESMMIGSGGAEQLEMMNNMWTPEIGAGAFDSNSASQLLKEAEQKRVEEFRARQKVSQPAANTTCLFLGTSLAVLVCCFAAFPCGSSPLPSQTADLLRLHACLPYRSRSRRSGSRSTPTAPARSTRTSSAGCLPRWARPRSTSTPCWPRWGANKRLSS